jgi:transposase
MKQKGDDYKITAVKYYLDNNDTMDNTCKIFNCKKPSLHRWIQIYKTRKNLQRKSRKSISYKVKKEQVKTALNMIDKNEQLTMDELLFDMKQKYPDFNITRQHLGRIYPEMIYHRRIKGCVIHYLIYIITLQWL